MLLARDYCEAPFDAVIPWSVNACRLYALLRTQKIESSGVEWGLTQCSWSQARRLMPRGDRLFRHQSACEAMAQLAALGLIEPLFLGDRLAG